MNEGAMARDGPQRHLKKKLYCAILTSALGGVGGQRHAPTALPRETDL